MVGQPPPASVRQEGSAAARFSTLRYGGPTTVIQDTVTVGATPSRVLTNNPRRVAWRLWNRSANSVDLSFSSGVVVGGGVPLSASTGVVESDVEIEGEEVIMDVWGIASAVGSTIVRQQVMRV